MGITGINCEGSYTKDDEKDNFKWLFVKKYFKGGLKTDYIKACILPNCNIDDTAREFAEDWAESTIGGHAYGWRVCWEFVDYPPKSYFEEELEKTETEIKRLEKSLNFYKEYKHMIEKQIIEGRYK